MLRTLTVKTQIKLCIVRHFIIHICHNWEIPTCDPLEYITYNPILLAFIFKENPPEYKGLIHVHFVFQFTEEKFGSAEKTELDAHFENLVNRADKTRVWTEKTLKQTEALLEPNPSKFLVVIS